MGFINQLETAGQHIVRDPRKWKSHWVGTIKCAGWRGVKATRVCPILGYTDTPKLQYLIRKVVFQTPLDFGGISRILDSKRSNLRSPSAEPRIRWCQDGFGFQDRTIALATLDPRREPQTPGFPPLGTRVTWIFRCIHVPPLDIQGLKQNRKSRTKRIHHELGSFDTWSREMFVGSMTTVGHTPTKNGDHHPPFWARS